MQIGKRTQQSQSPSLSNLILPFPTATSERLRSNGLPLPCQLRCSRVPGQLQSEVMRSVESNLQWGGMSLDGCDEGHHLETGRSVMRWQTTCPAFLDSTRLLGLQSRSLCPWPSRGGLRHRGRSRSGAGRDDGEARTHRRPTPERTFNADADL